MKNPLIQNINTPIDKEKYDESMERIFGKKEPIHGESRKRVSKRKDDPEDYGFANVLKR